MVELLIVVAGWTALLASFVFARLKGGEAERRGADVMLASWVGAYCVQMALSGRVPQHVWELTLLGFDGLIAVGLLVLAIRYTKLWLGVAMLMQSAELALHGAAMADWGFKFYSYILFNNVLSFAILLLLPIATAMAWSERKRAAARQANSQDDGRPGWAAPLRKAGTAV